MFNTALKRWHFNKYFLTKVDQIGFGLSNESSKREKWNRGPCTIFRFPTGNEHFGAGPMLGPMLCWPFSHWKRPKAHGAHAFWKTFLGGALWRSLCVYPTSASKSAKIEQKSKVKPHRFGCFRHLWKQAFLTFFTRVLLTLWQFLRIFVSFVQTPKTE